MKRRWLATLLMATTLGCTTMRPVADLQSFLLQRHPSRLRVTTANRVLLVQQPRLLGDTLIGWAGGEYQEVPLASIRRIDAAQPAPGRTLLLVGLAAAGLTTLLVTTHGSGPIMDPGIEYHVGQPH